MTLEALWRQQEEHLSSERCLYFGDIHRTSNFFFVNQLYHQTSGLLLFDMTCCPSYWPRLLMQLQKDKLGLRCSPGLLGKPCCLSWDTCRNNKMQKSLLLQAFFMRLLTDYLENRKDCVIWIILHMKALMFLIVIHYYT